MEELEVLKNDWEKKQESLPKYSKEELFQMVKGKSVSVVKMLLIFGIIEMIVWQFFLWYDNIFYEGFSSSNIDSFLFAKLLFFITFLVTVYRYQNKINASENSKALMKNILVLRAIIFMYLSIVLIGLLTYFITDYEQIAKSAYAGYIDGMNDGSGIKVPKVNLQTLQLSVSKILFIVLPSAAFIVVVVLVFYKNSYGKLLKKLKTNYTELKKVEDRWE